MPTEIQLFQETVWSYYHDHGRLLPWRQPEPSGNFDPYKILVSEIMLQQTQAPRVVPKYLAFLEKFPDARALAESPLSVVIIAWSGLGYNRRAKYLWESAQVLHSRYNGNVPSTLELLQELPGIGHNTAAAIIAYSYNKPVVFIETNIRTVYIHHFFPQAEGVHDRELLPIIEETIDTKNPREWYWALMDYGTHLKKQVGNTSRRSAHFTKQSPFKGSRRAVRGAILRELARGGKTFKELIASVPDPRTPNLLDVLMSESMICKTKDTYHL